jgi:hypothetical protein
MAYFKKWRGKEVNQAVMQNVAKALGEFALRAEGNSKRELQKGHGVETSTLRRSIHAAKPGYAWSGDDVPPSTGAPERGGKKFDAVVNGKKITIQLGSGLVYAMAIHQGWATGYKNMKGSFAGYHYLDNGVKKTKPELPDVLRKYRLK